MLLFFLYFPPTIECLDSRKTERKRNKKGDKLLRGQKGGQLNKWTARKETNRRTDSKVSD